MAVLKMIIENDIQVWLALTIGVLYLAGKLEKRKYGIGAEKMVDYKKEFL